MTTSTTAEMIIIAPIKRACAYCSAEMPPSKQGTAKFCSDACKMKAHRRSKEPVGPAPGVVVEPFAATLFTSPWLSLDYKYSGEFCTVEMIVDGVIHGRTVKAHAVKSAMLVMVDEAFEDRRRTQRHMVSIHVQIVTNRIITHFNSPSHPFKNSGNAGVTDAVTLVNFD